jgi:DNA-binding NtrC family response regulator
MAPIETVPLTELAARGLKPDDSSFRPVALVVDDERSIADTLVVILKKQGFAATAAYDGKSALDAALLVPPNVLITDVVMPGMSGIELAIEVKKALPDCQILLFSGQAATIDLLAEAAKSGYSFNVLAKPVHPTDLLAHVAELGVTSPERS